MTSGAEPSMEVRIAQCLTSDGSVIVPPRIARWLDGQSGMTADRRIRLRTTDREAYVVLTALYLAAIGSANGTKDDASQRYRQDYNQWVSTKEAAAMLDVTDRCIRKWCATGRIHAEQVGARWLVDPNSIDIADSRRIA
ncbi:helix-turn-helix domain-containing protein [Rhodococcus sp. SORGH_AS_0303]|uniref:helix-turn-helix domain-containing protein n=1 Tax=Rhodococcus sp. SORGH_AS_0303 TaxID=3041753 RepID=UPI00277DFAE7|nr:helix-turn-helix domain-containing protein [Rhodococcus sp. SORGH_AS_0303]MDQ1201086.1 excisionase family DNA binding protein [Rhodococcus sp. SORGH_AS_0303]